MSSGSKWLEEVKVLYFSGAVEALEFYQSTLEGE